MTARTKVTSPRSQSRAVLDAQIRTDGEILSEVARLLTDASPLASWPSGMTAALAQAISPQDRNAHEDDKAHRLRRHLFVDLTPPLLPSWPAAPGRWSDRIRADLADMVPFGTGLHLVDALTT